ncbi:undecaprenyl-diphosphate phosphatase [Buchnera aphidicola]|uniref:Undecaprenyl-diphosphatase n=1 Tax=Buchnera aphidicola subsp. Rhopalosiphum maidis TaxID=118109 RepID=A0A3G2I5T7_BUCRM|nr:undecaprenyl-diphosphate phosphatase [Buchnera aphidicola]AYN24443.1 undecaprenyl-diphosphate phosphatase [Buchnera aphidicola (Rhopalosiphum maidis)]
MFFLHKIIISIFIGITQGIAEFFPISSTGHMIIFIHWLNVENKETQMLETFVQLGSTLAVFLFFYKKILKLLKLKTKKEKNKTKKIHILLSILPTIFLGIIFYNKIKLLFNYINVMYALILGGFFLIISEKFKPKKSKTNSIKDINLIQSLIIGFFQTLCLYPGFSRSGASIAISMLLGLKRSVAINFSFIISIPLIAGASILDLIKNIQNINVLNISYFLTGFIVSFLVSFIFMKKLIKILNKVSLTFFGIYRFLIAGLIYLIK